VNLFLCLIEQYAVKAMGSEKPFHGTRHQLELSGQLQVPSVSSPGKRLRDPLDRRLGEPQIRSRGCEEEKDFALSGIEPGTSSP
jgi:hypothetical protein